MKERLIEYFYDKKYLSKTFDEMALDFFNIDKKELKSLINELITESILHIDKFGKIKNCVQMNLYKGIVSYIGYNKFNVLLYLNNNVYSVAFSKVDELIDGDIVNFSIESKMIDNKNEDVAVIKKIIAHTLEEVTGEVTVNKFGEKIIFYKNLKIKLDNKAIVGQIVFAKITMFHKGYLKGEVIKVIGNKTDLSSDITSCVLQAGFELFFKKEVEDEANIISISIDEEKKYRKIIDDVNVFTIDGIDAKDLDDAISLKKLANGNIQLGVYIADVSYYVKEDSNIDKCAYYRGTSVYLVDRVIPMLPHILSNDLCSLNDGKEKLVIACVIEVDNTGGVVRKDIFPAIINSKYKMTYDDVNSIIHTNTVLVNQYSDIIEDINIGVELFNVLNKKRSSRGAIDFDIPEAKIIVDKKGKAIDVILRNRDIAEKMIEEFMLLANEVVALTLYETKLPSIYRVHESIKVDKKEHLINILRTLNYKSNNFKVNTPKDIQNIINNIRKEDSYLNQIILELMSKAKYDTKNEGHFGLACMYYTHFTSPIRRYPDLIIHRLLRKRLFNNDFSKTKNLRNIALHSSTQEKRAMKLEYTVLDLKKCEFMSDKIGIVYEATISKFFNYGFFVELENTVSGFVGFRKYENVYKISDNGLYCINKLTNKRLYTIGDKVRVICEKVNLAKKQIDFRIWEGR